MHTDSAGAYQTKLAGVHHTKVVHQERVGRHWARPTFVKRVNLTINKTCRVFLIVLGNMSSGIFWQFCTELLGKQGVASVKPSSEYTHILRQTRALNSENSKWSV
eukprot:4678969-Amphidinium_carterae.1